MGAGADRFQQELEKWRRELAALEGVGRTTTKKCIGFYAGRNALFFLFFWDEWRLFRV
jgi:endonuclease III